MNMHLCQKAYVQMLIEENPLICACHHRSLEEVLSSLPHHTNKPLDDESLTNEQLETAEEIMDLVARVQSLTGASTGCGSCLPKVQGIVQCYQAKPEIFQSSSSFNGSHLMGRSC